MKCKICSHSTEKKFRAVILNKYDADYFYCDNCGFLQTENPYWLKEAYVEPINLSDTGYLQRNIFLSEKVFVLFSLLFGFKKNFLDYAGGYGVLVRLMRDFGLSFYWDDLYAQNIFAKGFEYRDQKISAVTCFECLEHMEKPIEEIEKMLKISGNVFFSTVLLPKGELPAPGKWWYYGLEHGQHIAFFSLKTLEFIAEKYNLNLCSNGADFHLLTRKKISNRIFNLLLFLAKLPLNYRIFAKLFLKGKTDKDSNLLKNK